MAYCAAAMYGAATLVGFVEKLIPGGTSFSLVPSFVALAVVTGLLVVGPRLPVWALASLGPVGAALIAAAIATTDGPGDGAALYAWPVLWQSYFFGRRGTVMIVAWVGIVHALALIALPPGVGYIDRWLDVMVSMVVIGAVVDLLTGQNERLLERLAGEARVDELTGLLNRRGLDEGARAGLARTRRTGDSLAIVSFDIDRFKPINDRLGHDAGDRVLERLGRIFREQTREGDLVARMGGEEFVAVLFSSDAPDALEYAERVRGAFADDGDPRIPLATLSAGVAAAVPPLELRNLLQRADAALYAAKRGGRDRTVVDEYATPS
jgi:diguanylate cyclase (GGDEF)-like protein